jgi:NAD-dependent deacetylase
MQPNIVILTGAGISAESGLNTFRDIDGLWNGYSIQEVATPEGFAKNPKLVLDFYNQRRREIAKAKPNAAHIALAELQNKYAVTIITQNIDDLHERAGSNKVIHLHGEIFKMRSVANPQVTFPITGDINLGDLAEDGSQLRPFIVWFNEEVPLLPQAAAVVAEADVFVIIGTSFQVYPAAGLIHYVAADSPIIVIDKKIPNFPNSQQFITIEQPATLGVPQLPNILNKIFAQ